MYAIPVTIEHGTVHLPPNTTLPKDARTAVLVLDAEIQRGIVPRILFPRNDYRLKEQRLRP